MAMTPEGKVKKDIRRELISWGLIPAGIGEVPESAAGWFYMPVSNGMGVMGIPDFIGCIGPFAKFFSIEAKAPKNGVVSETQKDRHKEIKSARGIVLVARGTDDIQALKELLRGVI